MRLQARQRLTGTYAQDHKLFSRESELAIFGTELWR